MRSNMSRSNTTQVTRRTLLGLLGGGIAGAVLVACGGATPQAATTPAPQSAPAATTPTRAPAAQAPAVAPTAAAVAAPTVAIQAAKVRFQNAWIGGGREELMAKLIEDFRKTYPQIEVENEPNPHDQTYYDKILTGLVSGSAPDVIMIPRRDLPSYVPRNMFTKLDDLLKRDQINLKQICYEAEAVTCQFRGTTYALPMVPDAGAGAHMFYNTTHFGEVGLDPQKPPQTWQETVEMGRKLTKKSGDTYEQLGVTLPLDNFIHMLAVNGGQLLNDDGTKIAFNSDAGLEVLEFNLKARDELYGDADLRPFFATYAKQTYGEWTTGRQSIYINGPWMFFITSQQGPDLKYGMALFPVNGNNPRSKSVTLGLGGWGYTIANERSTNMLEAAWAWNKYTTLGEGSRKFLVEAQGRPSPVRKYTEDPSLTKNNPFWSLVVKNAEQTTVVQPPVGWSEVDKLITKMVGDVMGRRASPREALAEAARLSQQVLDDNRKS